MSTEQKAVIHVHRPDIKEKLFFFLSGVLVSVPFTLFFSGFTDTLCVTLPYLFAQVCSVVIFAPFIEEFAKVFPLFYRHGETERSIMTLALLIGLGFGVTELMLYVFTSDATLISRLPGVIFHASSAGITSYGIAKKKPVPYYLIAVTLHLGNNLFALLGTDLSVIPGLAILVIAYLLAWRLYRQTSEIVIV
jgi:RsiW-degrading membrane proteinase PrsW (M82 family)